MSGRVDALIVGLGAAGGVLAKELTTAGLKVVALERGPALDRRTLHTLDEFQMSSLSALRANANQVITKRPDEQSPAVIENDQAAGIGGAAIHWAGLVWRFHEDDFRVRSATVERYGEEALPEDHLIEDWPISYRDLEPYYDRAEVELGISGVWAKDGGNPFEPPRQSDYPLPPLADSAASRTFREGARALGYHPFPAPAAILSRDYTGPLGIARRACTYCGFCRNHGCAVDAKLTPTWTVVPVAQATGNLEIRTGCTALRVNLDADGRTARSVTYLDETGTIREQAAGLIFVAAGSVAETVRLLLLSTSERHPAGLGNSSGWLGKAFMAHARPSVIALYDDRILNAHIGPNHANSCLDDLNGDNFDHSGLGFIRGGVVFHDVNGSGGPLAFADSVPPDVPRWGSEYKRYLARYFTRHMSIGAWLETLPSRHSYLDLDPVVKDQLGRPVARITARRQSNEERMLPFMLERLQEIARASGARKTWVRAGNPQPSGHETGGARMGSHPDDSVTDGWGRLWDAPNVFSSAALYPTMSGLNSTLTILAMAYRQGAYVRQQARAGGALARHV